MDKNLLYTDLYKEWATICSKSVAQKNATAFWNETKQKFCEKDFFNEINQKILLLRKEKMKKQPTLFECLYKKSQAPDPGIEVIAEYIVNSQRRSTNSTRMEMDNGLSASDQNAMQTKLNDEKGPVTPAQNKLKEELLGVGTTVEGLEYLKSIGMLTEETETILKANRDKRKKILTKISKLTKRQNTQQKYRKRCKEKFQKLKENHPELLQELKVLPGNKPGRPRVEENQPLLLTTILDIASRISSADPRRRSENLQSCTTLSQLHEELVKLGFNLSRSATYLRLTPRNRSSIQGRRHVVTVPVKLIRPQNDLHKSHPDGHFAAATIQFMKNLAEIMGPQSIFVLSQDDKARIPLGLVAANKQSPILMNMEYRIRLPDHDWVVAPRHKLIPSVYAALNFDTEGKLSYSGPTYIAIRSGKHDKSTAKSHSADLNRLIYLDNFKSVALTSNGTIKPIVMLLVDGGPDESPRFPKTIHEAVSNFKMFNLDALYVGCYAPGQSAFNPVERRMAPLSRDLCGIILPHDHYGTHLNSQGKTIDVALEKKNFQKAAECLASVWNENIIDGYNVFSEFVDVDNCSASERPSEVWLSNHIRTSKYFLQIVKCDKTRCCTPLQTNIKTVLPNGFFPAPVLFGHNNQGIDLLDKSSTNGRFYELSLRLAVDPIVPKIPGLLTLPFDLYCPTAANLAENICVCGISFPTKVACFSHSKGVHKTVDRILESEIGEINFENNIECNQNNSDDKIMQTILDVIQWYRPVFEEIF